MRLCKFCGYGIRLDKAGWWVDLTGGDVCGWDGTNSAHEPRATRRDTAGVKTDQGKEVTA